MGTHWDDSNDHVLIKWLNTLRPRQNGRHFADDIFKCIFLNENVWIPIKISLKFVPKGPINNIPALVQIMAWRRPGDKPLSEPMMVSLMMHICVTRPQWVKFYFIQNQRKFVRIKQILLFKFITSSRRGHQKLNIPLGNVCFCDSICYICRITFKRFNTAKLQKHLPNMNMIFGSHTVFPWFWEKNNRGNWPSNIHPVY